MLIFWKPFHDMISNLRILPHKEDISVLATSYDKTITLISYDGSIITTNQLETPPGLNSMGFFVKDENIRLENITHIFVGSATKKSFIYVLDPSLTLVDRITLSDKKFDRITFLKTYFLKNENILLSGSLGNLYIALGTEEIEVKIVGKTSEIPTDATLLNAKDELKIAVAFSDDNTIGIFKIVDQKLKMLSQFKEHSKPTQLIPFMDLLIIITEKGDISFRDLKGNLLFKITLNRTFGWKNSSLADVDSDNEEEILIGTQKGEYELAKNACSELIILKQNGEILYSKRYKGWIKFIRSPWPDKLILSVGKTLNFYQIQQHPFSLTEIFVERFDKPAISYDLFINNDKMWISLGLLDGELGIGLIEKNGKELPIFV